MSGGDGSTDLVSQFPLRTFSSAPIQPKTILFCLSYDVNFHNLEKYGNSAQVFDCQTYIRYLEEL